MEHEFKSLYQNYLEKKIERREFLKKASAVLGGTVAITAFLPMFESNYLKASGLISSEEDLYTEEITYPTATSEMKAFLARPLEDKQYPAVIVIHENRGLQPHIREVNKKMAAEGFLSIAPDALSPVGGTIVGNDEETRAKFREIDMEKTIENFCAAVDYLKTHPQSNGKVGCTGFCWGGAMTNHVAVNSRDLKAAVPYYGSVPESKDVAKINASVLAHYASNDERINAGIEAFENAMKEAGTEYQIFIYENTQHGFNNDTNPTRYNPEAAKLAWERTVAFFHEKLG
jgi:carboxymethylenebutenolidase